jgi:hypothetical protein
VRFKRLGAKGTDWRETASRKATLTFTSEAKTGAKLKKMRADQEHLKEKIKADLKCR